MASKKTGLRCSWGSELDFQVPRAKMPSTALPPSVRQSMGLAPRKDKNKNYWKPGFGIAAQRGSNNTYHAGNQKHFLKKGSGVNAIARKGLNTKRFQNPTKSVSTALINVPIRSSSSMKKLNRDLTTDGSTDNRVEG